MRREEPKRVDAVGAVYVASCCCSLLK